MKKTAAKGHTRKHTGTRKHHTTSKHHPVHHHQGATAHGHHVHTVAKHPKHAKARGLALAGGVACCAAEALAASLRLAGGTVSDDDVLELYEATACCHDAGASILATLEAASEYGLAGFRPALNEQVIADLGDDLAILQFGQRVGERLFRRDAAQSEPLADLIADRPFTHALILGVELPGPHSVTVDDRGRWWSWGRPWEVSAFPHAVIDEAWLVGWAE